MKKRSGKIGALVIFGMFVLMLYMPTALADSDTDVPALGSYSINIDSDNDETDRIFRVTHNGDPGTEIFRIQENGNVGIGVTSPDEKLEINGNLKFKEGADRTVSVGHNMLGNGYDLTIQAGSGSYPGMGAIGGDLHLVGGIGAGSYLPGGPGGNVYVYGGYGPAVGATPGDVILAHDGTTTGGKVGIGTANPGAALDVGGGTGTLADGAGDVLISDDLEVDDDVQIDGDRITTSAAISWNLASSTTALNFESGLLNIDTSNSRIGIGTTSPTGKLDIDGDDIRIRSSQTPGSCNADGYTGEIAWGSISGNYYVFVCVSGDGPGGSTDTWGRALLTTSGW